MPLEDCYIKVINFYLLEAFSRIREYFQHFMLQAKQQLTFLFIIYQHSTVPKFTDA